jgi:hypothetical protein
LRPSVSSGISTSINCVKMSQQPERWCS